MTIKKHLFLRETSTKFLLEQRNAVLKRLWEEQGLAFLNHKNALLWIDNGVIDEPLYKQLYKGINVLDDDITDQMFFDLLRFKMDKDESYQGFLLRSYDLPISFLEKADKFLSSLQQPAMHMLLMIADEQEELAYLLEQEKIEGLNELGESNLTTEEFVQGQLKRIQALAAPFKTYYQQHNRYHEVNISGKTEEEVYEEICQVIDTQ